MKEVATTQPLSYFLGLADYILNQKKQPQILPIEKGGILMLETVGVVEQTKCMIGKLLESKKSVVMLNM